MENKFCISPQEVDGLVKSLQAKNSFYKRETIERAILQCCKNKIEGNGFQDFEGCVEQYTKTYYLNEKME